MVSRLEDRPLFVVVGCTGTGKTKLGVRLAKELGGEVVSADSIQVYKGLDVATNKATEEETEGVPHHLMGTIDWGDECNVYGYRKEALKIIENIYSRGKVPVVVGGTSYYIESVIYNNLVRRTKEEEDDDDVEDCPMTSLKEHSAISELSENDFREYAMFRDANDAPTADTVDGAGRMYADAVAEAVRFARTMPAIGSLPATRYWNTFVDDGDVDRTLWPPVVAECETAALYAHGVRVLDAVADARRSHNVPEYVVSAADVTVGCRDHCTYADVRSRLDGLLSTVSGEDESFVKNALCRMHAELVNRTQRLALALLVEDERTVAGLISPRALKSHAMYFDPVAAVELHPHNTRKVFRTIQIYLMQGKPKSKLFKEQRTQVNGSDVPVVALRFKEVHMMWLTCDVDVLNKRLEARTDEMVERGLIDELCKFKKELAKKTDAENFRLDFTKGVLQCIGVKQFQQYLELSDESRQTAEGRKALEEALTAMKYVTRKYARRQVRWINNRFVKSSDKQAVSVYRLDCTDLGNWQKLSDQAVELAQVVLGQKQRTEHTLKPMEVVNHMTVLPVYGEYYCDVCSRPFFNDIQYNIHMSSKKHSRVMKKRKRKHNDTTLDYVSDNDNECNSRKKL